eukprot:TRINITY_DN2266_c0_g2_i1.p1 TRINITY_DN2266_c0_g2~~TRINITY_DN2266_c0_g2_i1.p1  ORF type:complete len:107 (-),score=28.18 TRINITY_DN2266_c0_g2_i1:403-723(-)
MISPPQYDSFLSSCTQFEYPFQYPYPSQFKYSSSTQQSSPNNEGNATIQTLTNVVPLPPSSVSPDCVHQRFEGLKGDGFGVPPSPFQCPFEKDQNGQNKYSNQNKR